MAAGRKKGTQKTGGRRKGTPNKSTVEVRAYAQDFGEDAISILANLMYKSEDEKTRISAAKEILDRAYGRAPQAMEVTGKVGGPIETKELDNIKRARGIGHILMLAERSEAALSESDGHQEPEEHTIQ